MRAAEIMRRTNLYACVAVNHGYHIDRGKRLLEAHGMKVHVIICGVCASRAPLLWLYFPRVVGHFLWQARSNI
jgi:hypothetical protein